MKSHWCSTESCLWLEKLVVVVEVVVVVDVIIACSSVYYMLHAREWKYTHMYVFICTQTHVCMCVYVCVQIFKIYWEKNFVKRQFSFVALFFPYTCIHTHTHTWIAQLQLHRSPTAIIFVCMYVCAWKGEAHATTLYCNKMQVHFIAILSWSGQG